MWSKNLVLLANMPPQVGQAATFSWVWLRRCSRSLQWSLKVQVQPGEEGPGRLQPHAHGGSGPPPAALQKQPALPGRTPRVLQRPELRSNPTFPATQHHMVVLANDFVFTAQAVRLHVPVEPLRIVEGSLCQEQLGVRTEGGWRDPNPMRPQAPSQVNSEGRDV